MYDNIKINLSDNEVEILDKFKIDIYDETNFGTITGWVSYMPKSHGANYGIHCYHKGQLIKPFNKIGFRAFAGYSRLIGKINIDFVPLTCDKSEFVKDSPEYMEVEERMSYILKPLLNRRLELFYKTTNQ